MVAGVEIVAIPRIGFTPAEGQSKHDRNQRVKERKQAATASPAAKAGGLTFADSDDDDDDDEQEMAPGSTPTIFVGNIPYSIKVRSSQGCVPIASVAKPAPFWSSPLTLSPLLSPLSLQESVLERTFGKIGYIVQTRLITDGGKSRGYVCSFPFIFFCCCPSLGFHWLLAATVPTLLPNNGSAPCATGCRCAHIQFSSNEEATAALALDGTAMGKRKMRVSLAPEKGWKRKSQRWRSLGY